MKATKLVEELQKLISEHGDLDVLSNDNEWSGVLISSISYDEKLNKYESEVPAFVIRLV
jgi:hypothetical protein